MYFPPKLMLPDHT